MNRNTLIVALVQEKWEKNAQKHQNNLKMHIQYAANQGAELVCLQELSLSPYFCTRPDRDPTAYMEDLALGPTAEFISQMAKQNKVCITASLFEKPAYNTAIAINADGQLIGFTRKQHIPSGEKYHENHYFKPGNSDYPIHRLLGIKVGLPTCYDQWFPELSRIYGLKGAELLIYPTAIGDEPTAPGFDSQPLWQKTMIAQGIMNNCFIIAVNRIGREDNLSFYGSSFISSPLGEILIQAPRDEPAVLLASLDFKERDLWGRLFPFNQQREPETYHELIKHGTAHE